MDSPWRGDGRFDNGVRYTLYLAHSAEGATAEFFRRHPEFLAMQEKVRIQLFKLTMVIPGASLNVRTEDAANRAGVLYKRLQSNDEDQALRFEECRALADDVESIGGEGIAYPSAAYDGTWNLVAFGEAAYATAIESIPRPTVDPTRVQAMRGASAAR